MVELVVRDLRKFYTNKLKVVVTRVPVEVRVKMLAFLDNIHDEVTAAPRWVRWDDNPHRRYIVGSPTGMPSPESDDNDNPPSMEDEDNKSDTDEHDEDDHTDTRDDNNDEPAVDNVSKVSVSKPLNSDGRICRCGSQTHLTCQHNDCPLNKDNHCFELFDDDSHARLLLYVPRQLWRYFTYDDGSVRKCHGEVIELTNDQKLKIKYKCDDQLEEVTEKELLKIFKVMKREIAKKRRRVEAVGGRARRVRRRLENDLS